jgi:peptidoglycan hydrolase CwlO-like protein
VEIVEPEEISDENHNISGMLNDLAMKMHQYDDVVKKLRAQNALQKRLLVKAKAKLDKLGVETKDIELRDTESDKWVTNIEGAEPKTEDK